MELLFVVFLGIVLLGSLLFIFILLDVLSYLNNL